MSVGSRTTPIDPAGTVAGIMARTDTRVGVWKAPAGLTARTLGARGLEHLVTDPELQNVLTRFDEVQADIRTLSAEFTETTESALLTDKIVADGLDDDGFDVTDCGKHVSAAEFNALASLPDTVVVDMRNHYESEVGHFKGAILPAAETFRDEIREVEDLLQDRKEENIVLYCTGGIRCEKASAYLKHKGFPNVHQLEGGIIEYVRQVRADGLENRFRGVNFVFDERMAERVSDDVVAECHHCGAACDAVTNCSNAACNVLMVQCPACAQSLQGTCGTECQTFIALPEDEQKARRSGTRPERRTLNRPGSARVADSD